MRQPNACSDAPTDTQSMRALRLETPHPSASPIVVCHVERIPPFVGAALAGLYEHVFASLEYFKIFKPHDRVSTLVVRSPADASAALLAVLLFRTSGARAEVFNEFCAVDNVILQYCATEIFSRFSGVQMICFRHLVSAPRQLLQPFQCHNAAEDYVLHLPDSVQRYTESLGKSTRRNIRRYHDKLLQDHPSFAIRFDVGPQINENDVAALLALSRAKIRSQGKTFSVDDGYARAMAGLMRHCGFVAVATIDGKVCAGLICYRTGNGFMAKVVAHESRYDDYWLGTLCYYLTICEALRRGGRIFNMGTQRYDYKERLCGVRRDLDHLTIYRSRWKQALHADSMLRMALGRHLRRAKLWVQARESRQAPVVDRLIGRIARRIAGILRALQSRFSQRR